MFRYLKPMSRFSPAVLLLCALSTMVQAQEEELKMTLHVRNPQVRTDGKLEYEVRITNMTGDIARRIAAEKGVDAWHASGYPRELKLVPVLTITPSGSLWIRGNAGEKFEDGIARDSFYNPDTDGAIRLLRDTFYGATGRVNLQQYDLPGAGSYELVVRYTGAPGFKDLIKRGFWAGELEASAPFEVIDDTEEKKPPAPPEKPVPSPRETPAASSGGGCSCSTTGSNNSTWTVLLLLALVAVGYTRQRRLCRATQPALNREETSKRKAP